MSIAFGLLVRIFRDIKTSSHIIHSVIECTYFINCEGRVSTAVSCRFCKEHECYRNRSTKAHVIKTTINPIQIRTAKLLAFSHLKSPYFSAWYLDTAKQQFSPICNLFLNSVCPSVQSGILLGGLFRKEQRRKLLPPHYTLPLSSYFVLFA